MRDAKESVLDKAESMARRVLERLGSSVDNKISGDQHTMSAHIIAELTSRIEHLIDSSLREDETGARRLAPNRFKVLFTYEETSELSPQYIEAVGKELTATVFEFINNRRYKTRGPVEVKSDRDVFARTTVVKAGFDGDSSPSLPDAGSESPARNTESKVICISGSICGSFRFELTANGPPAYLGRAAGNAVRIDDPSISRLHCSLTLKADGSVVIGDLGSANGTYLNHTLLGRDEARPLKSGDVIKAGDLELTVLKIS